MKANNRQILTIIKDPRGKNKSNERSQTIICCLFQNMYTAFFFLFQYILCNNTKMKPERKPF